MSVNAISQNNHKSYPFFSNVIHKSLNIFISLLAILKRISLTTITLFSKKTYSSISSNSQYEKESEKLISKVSCFFESEKQLTLNKKPISAGAQGAVYLLTDPNNQVKFVFKMYNSEYMDLEELKKTIQLTSCITHPRIITAINLICDVKGQITSYEKHDKTISGKLIGVTLPYVEGVTLYKAKKQLKMQPLEDTLKLLYNLTTTVDAMHVDGVIHRDLHWGNIMVENDKSGEMEAIIIDLDLAQPFIANNSEDESDLTILIIFSLLDHSYLKEEQHAFLNACLVDYQKRIHKMPSTKPELKSFLENCIAHLTEIVKETPPSRSRL